MTKIANFLPVMVVPMDIRYVHAIQAILKSYGLTIANFLGRNDHFIVNIDDEHGGASNKFFLLGHVERSVKRGELILLVVPEGSLHGIATMLQTILEANPAITVDIHVVSDFNRHVVGIMKSQSINIRTIDTTGIWQLQDAARHTNWIELTPKEVPLAQG